MQNLNANYSSEEKPENPENAEIEENEENEENEIDNDFDETNFSALDNTVDFNKVTDSKGSRVNLSVDQERIIQKLPSFRVGNKRIKDDRIDSDKYLDFKEYEPLILRNPPVFFWTLGIVFISFGIVLIINIVLYKYKKNFFAGFFGKSAWEYVILVAIFIFGVTFFFVSDYESITIDKIKGLITLRKYDVLTCEFHNLDIEIKNINAIFPVRVYMARSSSMERSCLTQIGLTFDGTNTVYFFKTIFRYFTIKTVIKLRTFLYKRIQKYETVDRELDGTSTYINVVQDRLE